MQILCFRGTAEEFRAVEHLFAPERPNPAPTPTTAQEPAELTAEVLERALTRIPLSPGQQKFLRALIDAGAGGLSAADVQARLGISGAQYAGLTGALGRRFANTEGWPKGAWPTTNIWDPEHREWRYAAHRALLEVFRRGKI
jgi:hypothetical protein